MRRLVIGLTAVVVLWGVGQVEGAIETKLTASDATAFDQFGYSVAISSNTAIVGAPGDDNWTGSAYLYEPGTNPIPEPSTLIIWAMLGTLGITTSKKPPLEERYRYALTLK